MRHCEGGQATGYEKGLVYRQLHTDPGDAEQAHYHKIATEFTVIISGRVRMNGVEYEQGDILVMEPGDVTDFEALEDSVNVVVKIPGANHDKYLVEG